MIYGADQAVILFQCVSHWTRQERTGKDSIASLIAVGGWLWKDIVSQLQRNHLFLDDQSGDERVLSQEGID